MANLVITSTTNTIKVAFNDSPYRVDTSSDEYTIVIRNKSRIKDIMLNTDHVDIYMDDNSRWIVSDVEHEGGFKVDSIDGVAPSSLLDLCNKLAALIA